MTLLEKPVAAEAPASDDALPAPWAAPSAAMWDARRRHRRMLGLSMLIVVPIGVLALATGINVALLAGATTSYQQKDYRGSASWARAAVSLNPVDGFLPHFDLGTAYSAGGLLDDAVPELSTAIAHAPSAKAACPAVANLAITFEKLGDRAKKAGSPDRALDFYGRSERTWASGNGAGCGKDQSFSDKSDSAKDSRSKSEQQAQKQKDKQDQQQGQGQQGQGQQNGQGQQGQGGTQQGQGGSTGDQQGQGQQGGDQQGQSGQGGDQQGQGQGGSGGDQQGQGGGGAQGQGDGGSSQTLGDKLGQLENRGDQSERSRNQGDEPYGGSSTRKPW